MEAPGAAVLSAVAGLAAVVPLEQVVRRAVDPDRPEHLPPATRIVLWAGVPLLLGAVGATHAGTAALPALLVGTAGLVALALVDLRHLLLPNRVVYPFGFATAALLAVAAMIDDEWGAFGRALAAGAAGFVLMALLRLGARGQLGFGDVRLGVLIGVLLGWDGWGEVFVGFFAAFLLGGLAGGVVLLAGGDRRTKMPFGPFLAAGALVALLAGDAILDWWAG